MKRNSSITYFLTFYHCFLLDRLDRIRTFNENILYKNMKKKIIEERKYFSNSSAVKYACIK